MRLLLVVLLIGLLAFTGPAFAPASDRSTTAQPQQTRAQCEFLCQVKMNASDKTNCMKNCQGLPEATATPAPATTTPSPTTASSPPTTPITSTPTPGSPSTESARNQCYRECGVNPYSTIPWSNEQWNCLRSRNCQGLPASPPAPPASGQIASYTKYQCYSACAKKADNVLQTRWGRLIDPDAYKNCVTTNCSGSASMGACTAGSRQQLTFLNSYTCNELGLWALVSSAQAQLPACMPRPPLPRQLPGAAPAGRATDATGNSGFLQWLARMFSG